MKEIIRAMDAQTLRKAGVEQAVAAGVPIVKIPERVEADVQAVLHYIVSGPKGGEPAGTSPPATDAN